MGYQVKIEGWGQPLSPELQTVSPELQTVSPEPPPESSYWHGDFYRVRRFDGKFLTLGHVKRKRHSDRFVAYCKDEEAQMFSPFDDTETKEEAKRMVEVHFGHWPPKLSQSEKIEAAIEALGQVAPNAHFILSNSDSQGAQDLAQAALKALAILEGRDRG